MALLRTPIIDLVSYIVGEGSSPVMLLPGAALELVKEHSMSGRWRNEGQDPCSSVGYSACTARTPAPDIVSGRQYPLNILWMSGTRGCIPGTAGRGAGDGYPVTEYANRDDHDFANGRTSRSMNKVANYAEAFRRNAENRLA